MIAPYPIHSESIGNVAPAIAAAQREIPTLIKDAKGYSEQRFVSLEALKAAAFPVLALHGLSIHQFTLVWPGDVITLQRSVLKREGDFRNAKHVQFFESVASLGVFRSQVIHTSGEWMACDFTLFANPGEPKELGALVGHFRRYSIELLLGIAKADDAPTVRGTAGRNGKAPRRDYSPPPPVPEPEPATMPEPEPPAAVAEPERPLIPSIDDPDEISDGGDVDPGSSPAAFIAWLYDRGGCGSEEMRVAVIKWMARQGYPVRREKWTAEHCRECYDAVLRKQRAMREAAKAGMVPAAQLPAPTKKRANFNGLPPVVATAGQAPFDEFRN